MSTIRIPGPVANQLRQGLTLSIGKVAQALEAPSMIGRDARRYEQFAESFQQLDAIRALLDALGWEHEPNPVSIEVDLETHISAAGVGLDEMIDVLRDFASKGSRASRLQAATELREVEDLKMSLSATAQSTARNLAKDATKARPHLIRLGEKFRRTREQRQVTVAELADRTGIAVSQINNLEEGHLDPEYDVLIGLAEGMNVPLTELIPKD